MHTMNPYYPTSSYRRPGKTPPAPASDPRIARLADDILDVTELVLDNVRRAATPPAPVALPLAVERRVLANCLRTARFCPNATCRRAQCCRGEPLHCLAIAIPLLPPRALDRVIVASRRRA